MWVSPHLSIQTWQKYILIMKRFFWKGSSRKDKYSNLSYLISGAPCVILQRAQCLLRFRYCRLAKPFLPSGDRARQLHLESEKYTWEYLRNTNRNIWEIHMGISEKYTWEHSRNTHDTWEVWQRKKKKVNSVLLLSDLKINLSSFFTLLYFLNCRWLTLMRRRSIKFWENVCNGLRLTSAHHTNTYQLITNKR